MKKILSLILAAMLIVSACAVAFAEEAEARVINVEELEVLEEFGELTLEDMEYDPNPDYDMFTVMEYYIEDADTEVIATISAKADFSEFCMEYSFYGDDQKCICDGEGNISFDATGFTGRITPGMLAQALELEDEMWSAMPVVDLVFGELTLEDMEYDPNPDYDVFTLIAYYIADADTEVIATVSAKEDLSEFCMEYSFYGDDQKCICDAEGNISFDATGFTGRITPGMLAAVLEADLWVSML